MPWNIFHSFTKCSKETPILLIMDNHPSHLDYQVITFAKENGIIILTLPPHCSHVLQPLDVTVFGPFKKAVGCSQNNWLHQNPDTRISIKDKAMLSWGPNECAFNEKNIINGFVATGIVPFKRFRIPEERFAPSLVTDRPGKKILYNFWNVHSDWT